MAQLRIDATEIADSYGVIKQVSNSGIIEATNDLARTLMPLEGENALADELLTNCREFQAEYNENYLPSVTKLLQSFSEMVDISDYLEKQASVGDLAKVDTGFAAGRINADAVKM